MNLRGTDQKLFTVIAIFRLTPLTILRRQPSASLNISLLLFDPSLFRLATNDELLK